jgi:hypothetical protein
MEGVDLTGAKVWLFDCRSSNSEAACNDKVVFSRLSGETIYDYINMVASSGSLKGSGSLPSVMLGEYDLEKAISIRDRAFLRRGWLE